MKVKKNQLIRKNAFDCQKYKNNYFLLITEKSLGNIYSFLFSKQLSYSTILTIIKKIQKVQNQWKFWYRMLCWKLL